MEQVNLSTTRDREQVYQILGDLLHMNREFQIMISVPSESRQQGKESRWRSRQKRF